MGLSTVIRKENTDAHKNKIEPSMLSTMHRLRTWDFRTQVHNSSDKSLRFAFSELGSLKDKLGLSDAIIERTVYIYRKAQERGMLRGRSMQPAEPTSVSKEESTVPLTSDNHDNPILQIRHLESQPEFNVTTVTIPVVDRKASLAIEKVDDSKESFVEAVGLSTYSTSQPTVTSYLSIFENFWNQLELYEKLKEHDKIQQEFINIAANRTPVYSRLCRVGKGRSSVH